MPSPQRDALLAGMDSGPYPWTGDDPSFIQHVIKTYLPPEMIMPEVVPADGNLPPALVRKLRRAPQVTQAYLKPQDPRIFMNAWTDAFQDGRKGKSDALMRLAGQLVHEYTHLYSGPAESTAYDAQLGQLRRTGASPKTLAEIEAAKAWREREDAYQVAHPIHP